MGKVSPDIAALVLFLSREQLPLQEYDRARARCAKVTDWDLVAAIAARKFVAPMLYNHLSKIKPANLPSDTLEKMKTDALLSSAMSLKIAAAQSEFYKKCLAPVKCRHVFLKGVALAQQYYQNPGMRVARDIDVLVPDDAIEDVVLAALTNGYRLKIKEDVLTSKPDRRTLNTLLKYDQIVPMLSPENVWFEIHTRIDYGLEIFATERLLAGAISLDGTGTGPCGPPTTEHFCFVCYHSTRHTWSRLHWLADANSMMQHPSFVLEDVMEFAVSVGLDPTVAATLEFLELARTTSWVGQTRKPKTNAQKILSHAIANLEDDFQTEMDIRAKFGYLGLPYSWMLNRDSKLRAYLNRSVARILPSYYLYEKIPLPEWLQWLYYPIKPFFVFWQRIIRRKSL